MNKRISELKARLTDSVDLRYRVGMRVVKTCVAIMICLALPLFVNYDSNLPQISAVTALVTLRATQKDTFRTGWFRIAGTLLGGLLGLLCVIIGQIAPYYYSRGLYIIIIPLVMVLDFYLCNLFKVQDLSVVSCVVIILIAARPGDIMTMNTALMFTLYRTFDTLFGVLIAMAVNNLPRVMVRLLKRGKKP